MQLLEMEVTPEQAREWLQSKRRNRTFSPKQVALYARMMREGAWVSRTNEAVAFDDSGQLVDGEHRLRAVLACGQAIKMAVAFGCNAHIGIARTRSVADVGVIEYDIKMPRNAAAIIRTMLHNDHMTPRETINAYQQYQAAIDFAAKALRNTDDTHIDVAAVQAGIARAYYHVNEESLKNFCDALKTGFMKYTIDATAIALAKLLKRAAKDKRASTMSNTDRMYCTQQAIAHYQNGKAKKSIDNPGRDLFGLPM